MKLVKWILLLSLGFGLKAWSDDFDDEPLDEPVPAVQEGQPSQPTPEPGAAEVSAPPTEIDQAVDSINTAKEKPKEKTKAKAKEKAKTSKDKKKAKAKKKGGKTDGKKAKANAKKSKTKSKKSSKK